MYRTITNHLRPLFALLLLTLTLALMLLIATSAPLKAQANRLDLPAYGYFLKPDDNNVVQLWQLPVQGTPTNLITNSSTSLVDYAISNDGSQVAYTAGGQLWLQTFGERAVALTTLAEDNAIIPSATYPLFSPDDSEIVYSDRNGLYVIPAAGGQAQLIRKNIPLGANAENAAEYRHFRPARFIPDSDMLIVNVSIWEGYTVGIIDLATGEYQELPRAIHTDALPLSNGDLLISGNSGMDGEFDLQIATAYDLGQRQTVLNLMPLSDMPLYVQQAVEIKPGIVRVLGNTAEMKGETVVNACFYFDFDVENRALIGEVVSFPLLPSTAPETFTWVGKVSPDGRILPQISNLTVDLNGVERGQLSLYELATGTVVEIASQASSFQWR